MCGRHAQHISPCQAAFGVSLLQSVLTDCFLGMRSSGKSVALLITYDSTSRRCLM